MSVRIGTPAASRTRARTRSPSSMPGPRNDLVEVRLALSNEALNTYCTPARFALSRRARARPTAWASLSITHGPAIRRSGDPPPIVSPANWIGATALTYHGRSRLLGDCDLVPVARPDEPGEQRVRLQRLGLELRVELHGDVPGVIPPLDDLDELAVEGAAHDLHAVVGQGLLVEAVELVAVAVALLDHVLAIQLARQRAWLQGARVRAQAHRAAEIVD